MKKTTLDYIAAGLNPEFKLWDYIDVQKMAETLNVDYLRILKFLQADERCDCYYYSEEQCGDEYQELLNDFRECQNDTREPMSKETLAGKVARETGLELIGEATNIYNWGY